MFRSQSQSSCQPRLGPDAGESHPGVTVGESRMFQGEGAPSRTPLVPPPGFPPLPHDFRASQPAPSRRAPPSSAPHAAPRASARQAPRPQPPFGAPPQPSTSGWVPPGPPPPRSRRDSSEASESESVSSVGDTASARVADLIYEVCPDSRPLFDARAPRCGFEAWFGQPEAAASRQRFRMYPRVAEVQEEVAARSEALARRAKPLSRVIPAHAYAMADDAIFTSSQPVNSAFAQLVGSCALGSRRWGSITFSEMERLERLFQGQLEVTSSSLWLMSGILAMLKRDGFQPSAPALFNLALSSVSAALSRQARTAAAGSTFIRAKRRESLLAHTTLLVPETQNLRVCLTLSSSRRLSPRSRAPPRFRVIWRSSPLTGPRLPSFARGRPSGKRSSSSSRSGGRKRFRGGKGGGGLLLPALRAITFQDPIRRLSVPPLAGLEGQGCGALGGRGAAGRLLSAFPQHPSTFQCSAPNSFLQPHLHQGGCSGGGHLRPRCQGCCGTCSTPFSRLLQPSVRSVEDLGVVASSHRPLHLNRFVDVSPFQMEIIQSVLLSVRQGDWMASIDLKEAYLQVPVHPASRHFLRFVFRDKVYQFKALCFGLSTALQVFTRVMAPVSAILHSMGIRMRRYLDDWLVQSSSRESLLRDLQTVLHLCHEFGIVVNPQKSNLIPSQVVQYLGVIIDSTSFRASPSPERISRLLSTAGEFQSSASPPASLWLSLLGVLSSLAHLVPGGCLRMRSLQLCLHRSWDRLDLEAAVSVSTECLHLPRLSLGVSLCQVSSDLHFWSDASDVGWGAHLDRQVASGLWDSHQAVLSINARELLAVQLGLRQFQSSLRGRTVAVFCDNTTAVAYLRKEGGTRSPLLNSLAQEILRWTSA